MKENPTERKSYWCVTCEDCHGKIPLREHDLNLQYHHPMYFNARCLSCGTAAAYHRTECHQYSLLRIDGFEPHPDFPPGKVVP